MLDSIITQRNLRYVAGVVCTVVFGALIFVILMATLTAGNILFPANYIGSLVGKEFVAAALAGLIAFRARRGLSKLPFARDMSATKKLWLVPAGLTLILLPSIITLLVGGEQTLTHLLLLAIFSLLVGTFEEVLFRFVLFRSLLPYGTGIAIIGSSLVFGLVHMSGLSFIAAANCLPQIAGGVLFGLMYLFSGKLIHAIGAHALWDFGLFAATMKPGDNWTSEVGNATDYHPITLVFGLFILMYFLMYRRVAKENMLRQEKVSSKLPVVGWQELSPTAMSFWLHEKRPNAASQGVRLINEKLKGPRTQFSFG